MPGQAGRPARRSPLQMDFAPFSCQQRCRQTNRKRKLTLLCESTKLGKPPKLITSLASFGTQYEN